MNWIDKKYKDALGNRKFPDSLRDQGKADLEKLLNREMPAPKPPRKGGWFYGGLTILLVAIVVVPAGWWYWQLQENVSAKPAIEQVPVPSSHQEDGADGRNNRGEDFYETNPAEDVMAQPIHADEASYDETTISDGANVSNTSDDASEIKEEQGVQEPVEANPVAGISKKDVPDSPATNTAVAFQGEDSDREETTNGVENNSPDQKSDPVSEEEKNREIPENEAEMVALPEEVSPNDNPPSSTVNKETVKDDSSSPISEVSSETTKEKPVTGETPPESNPETEKIITASSDSGEQTSANEAETTPAGKTASSASAAGNLQYNLSFGDFQAGLSAPDMSQHKPLSLKRMAVSLWGGYTFVNKKISGGTESYRALRNNKEEPVWTVPAGFTFDYYLNRKWTLSVGIGWSEHGENLDYPYQSTDSVLNMDGRYDSPRNYSNISYIDSIRRVDSINLGHWEYNLAYLKEDTAIKNNNGQTRWSYIEIPVMVGYRFGTGRIKPWVQTGISFGIPYASSFRYISPSGESLQSREDGEASVAPLQYSYLLKLGVDCYLSQHFSLRLNALGSYQINPAFKFYGIEQRYYRLGGTIGVAYNF